MQPVEVSLSVVAHVGAASVRRSLPRRSRRRVGPWCFADHFGPLAVRPGAGMDVGPHPHCGLQTVTWLSAGELEHHDSLGSEQVIRPGQLNLMSAGHGVAHSEEATAQYEGRLEGIQLWVAQPEATRDSAPAFEHHRDLPSVDLGAGRATVLVGELHGALSPARRDSDLVGAELVLRGASTLALRPDYEHALIVLEGDLALEDERVGPGALAYLAPGREEVVLEGRGPTRAMLVGGVPMDEEILVWWNFVARTRAEVEAAREAWERPDGRFGEVASLLTRIGAPATLWSR